jgi:hypothetical protein
MTSYDANRDAYDRISEERTGYRPGWVWIPIAVVLLLTILLIGVGFVYGGYNDPMRGYDDGTAIEQSGGQITQPNLATPVPNSGAPELGPNRSGDEPASIPEAAPALANDGQ